MIAVDASAALAILLGEPEADEFRARLRSGGGVMSPVNHWEVLAKAHSLGGADAAAEAQQTLVDLGVEIGIVNESGSLAAFEAFTKFGKSQGGPLNLGDCFAYALARAEGDGLLFKGADFPKTDVKPAI